MTAVLSHALQATDAELHERVFEALLRLIVAFVPFGTSARDNKLQMTGEQVNKCLLPSFHQLGGRTHKVHSEPDISAATALRECV